MEYVYKHMDWSNVEVLGRNRLPVRPFYCGYPNKESARQGRREECSNYRLLNGQWKFAYYESPFYVPDTCMEKEYDDREFGMMPVPGHWQLNGYDYPHYNDAIALFPILDDPGIQADNPTGVYRYTFQEEKQKDREYILRFDGVESAYHVWLNGTFIGYSQGPRNTAEFDVTEALQDGENVLAVIVYKFSDGSYLENQDMWWFAGIIRDVSLIRRPKQHMRDWRIVSDPVMEQNDPGALQKKETTGKICLEAVFENHTEDETALTVEMEVMDGEQVIFSESREISGKKGETEYVTRNRRTAILISHKILCCCQIPAKWFSKRTRDSGISLVEQIECIVLSKRHAIAKPGIWMLIINFHNFPLFPARRHIIIL